MTKTTHSSRSLSALLMVGASSLALATPAQANEYLFTSQTKPLQIGERQTQTEKLTQIRLTGGGTASFTDNAQYQINADGSIELYKGSVTVASDSGKNISVRMPDGLEANVYGRGASANFSVQDNGKVSGHAITGDTRVGRRGGVRAFRSGDMWAAEPGGRPRRVVANEAQSAPEAGRTSAPAELQVAAIRGDAGPVAAALNGVPVTLGDALAAAGASSDILGAARRVEQGVGNPALDTFPSGDLALLVARAAEIENANGGSPFPQAQADIIRAYLGFLANGGTGAQFLSSFSAFSLDYLDVIRAGGVPSGFGEPGLADINAYLAFIDRTGALAQLSASDRILAEAYLGFLRDGGNPDLFAGTFTNLTEAFFAFVRAGNAPADFQDASQAALGQTIAFLSDSGLVQQLSAADQALVNAFLANGGLAFAGQFQTALSDYFAFLSAGGLPSAYEPFDQADLRQFLETLSDTGLLNSVLGDQAQFYADYLAFLRGGGDVDAFAGLPVNIFTDYAAQLAAYRAFLDAGNAPSAFTGADPALLQSFIDQLQAAGALQRFVGADAAFFAAFAAFVNDGGAFDAFAGLNANIFAGYAADLQAYFAFLEAGGVPTTYQPLSQEVIAQYLAELQAAGAKARFLPELNDFYVAYFAFISEGGNPDNFAGLPVPPDFGAFAAALNAYADFLAGGGFPADFDGTDLSVLASFIEALGDAGELDARLGANADLLQAYFAFIAGGGAPNQFAGLPIFANYVAELNAYFAFLANGGFPQDYTELDQATLNSFLAALRDAQGGLSGFGDLNAFFADYAAFVLGGGDPSAFTGLPIYAQYVADLNAYFAFLANGGLPEDYTVLDPATLTAYLEALAGAQGGLASFAGLDDFFDAYAAFVLGGGDPSAFASLPVFNQYIADLNAYFAFLAAGGLPSEYTVLDQATLNAYLEALANAQGGLAGFAALNQFFIDFFAFLQGGGNVDQFAGLPVNMGGGGGQNGIPVQLTGYSGGFDAANAIINIAISGNLRGNDFTGGESGFSISDYTLAENGALQRYNRGGNFERSIGNMTATDIFGNGDVVIGRWTDGTFRASSSSTFSFGPNQGLHYMLARQSAVPVTLPATGRLDYYLVAATRPTVEDGSLEPGVFSAQMGILLGTQPLFGIEGNATFNDGDTDVVYAFETRGGIANIEQSETAFSINLNNTVSIFVPGLPDDSCNPDFCGFRFNGAFGGTGTDTLGATYQILTGGSRPDVSGAAIFEAGPERTGSGTGGSGGSGGGGSGVPSGTGTPLILANTTDFAATSGVKYNISAPATRLNGFDLPTFTLAADGALTSATDGVSVRGIGTATATDISGNSRFLIGRWTDGEYETDQNSEETALTSAQGFHYLLAGPAGGNFTLPTMGSIEYELIAATAPTIADGSLAPGRFEADMIVLFGASPTVAMEGSITLPTSGDDYVYSFASSGGIANPSQSDSEFRVRFGRNINFEFRGDQITTSDNSCDDTCVIQFGGYFAGDDALEMGLTYTAQTGTIGRQISGAAIFGNGVFDDGSTGGGMTGSGFTGTRNGIVYYTYTNGSLASAFGGSADLVDSELVNFTSALGTVSIGSAEVAEAGDVETMSWARWTNGTVETRGVLGNIDTVIGANGGYHVLAGTASTSLPASGTINYELIGSTAATDNLGSAPGTVTGDLAIAFGSTNKVGFDMAMDVGGRGYAVSTEGGAANPGASEINVVSGSGGPTFSASFNSIIAGSVTGSGGACVSSCQVLVSGALYGDNASHVGVAMNIFDGGEGVQASGLALFGAPGAAGTASGFDAATARTTASIAPNVVPATMNGGQWARWGGSGSASVQGAQGPGTGGEMPAVALDLLPPGLSRTEIESRLSRGTLARETVIRQAESIMGGAISFARPGAMERPQ